MSNQKNVPLGWYGPNFNLGDMMLLEGRRVSASRHQKPGGIVLSKPKQRSLCEWQRIMSSANSYQPLRIAVFYSIAAALLPSRAVPYGLMNFILCGNAPAASRLERLACAVWGGSELSANVADADSIKKLCGMNGIPFQVTGVRPGSCSEVARLSEAMLDASQSRTCYAMMFSESSYHSTAIPASPGCAAISRAVINIAAPEMKAPKYKLKEMDSVIRRIAEAQSGYLGRVVAYVLVNEPARVADIIAKAEIYVSSVSGISKSEWIWREMLICLLAAEAILADVGVAQATPEKTLRHFLSLAPETRRERDADSSAKGALLAFCSDSIGRAVTSDAAVIQSAPDAPPPPMVLVPMRKSVIIHSTSLSAWLSAKRIPVRLINEYLRGAGARRVILRIERGGRIEKLRYCELPKQNPIWKELTSE